jgi:hypothetical protein
MRKNILSLIACAMAVGAMAQSAPNRFEPWTLYETPSSGLFWPEGQALPHFATPAETLDGLSIGRGEDMTDGERVMFASLQGLINRTKPRIFLYDQAREGKNKWAGLLGLKVNEYPVDRRWELLAKYKDELKGVVLYSAEKSLEYRNLATTVGGLRTALPVTADEYARMKESGIELPVVEDISALPYETPVEIYRHLYDKYWPECTKRLYVSHRATNAGYVRDMAIATGAAIAWLDPRKPAEKEMLGKFLADMTPGESIMIGWWGEERSGIGAGVEYGIATIPADYYENSTVYAGMDHRIDHPVVPKKPVLENKIYLAVYLSDGDNVQYDQHAMSTLWDDAGRGSMPINWTVSPGMVDFGPGLLNYYYKTATPNDFFASGPSGLGYALIYDAHNYRWNTRGRELFDPYTRFTGQYLEKSGLRVITVWDQVDQSQMDSYADNCRYLYGLTQQDWERQEGDIPAFRAKDRLPVVPNLPCYASGVDVIYRFWEKPISEFDGKSPMFLSSQGESWKMGPDNIAALRDSLERLSPGNIVICRGDHFFALYNEAHGMPFNLTLSPEMEVTSSPTSTDAAFAADGTPSGDRKWIASGRKKPWIVFDFKGEYEINRYVVRHAGADGMDPSLNTRDFVIETSLDGKKWAVADRQSDNTLMVSDVDIPVVKARMVRLRIVDAGADGIARIGDVEIYGKKL